MATLTNAATVEQLGALIPQLFDTDQTGLDALVNAAISDSDNWMRVYLAADYGGITAPETAVQAKAQALLAMSFLEPTLRAKKVRGTQYPLDQEDAAAFEDLLEKDWEGEAKEMLAKWLIVEPTGGAAAQNFALPFFAVTDGPDPLSTDSEPLQIREIDDEARGLPEVDYSTVTR